MAADRTFAANQRFEVRHRLGAGGMGVVYEAYDRERQELVALKTLRHTGGPQLVQFKREFRALHDLSHPNLVSLGELFAGESEPFFSMELVRGVNFLDYVRGHDSSTDERPNVSPTAATAVPGQQSNGNAVLDPTDLDPAWPNDIPSTAAPAPQTLTPVPFDEARLRTALKQLAVGIAALHEAGMVHRDIKPSNVLITSAGRVVLLDFGLVAQSAVSHQSTDAGLVGTILYMAPEQAISGDVTPAADWYSFGVMLFEALTGALPHTGETPFDIVMKKQKFMAAPARQFVASVPPDLDALCSGLLTTEVADRLGGGDIFDRLGIDANYDVAGDSQTSSAGTTAPPFVGRSNQLDALHAAYDKAFDSPLVYLIEGVSGVGKSQLVEEFLSQLTRDDPNVVVLSGRCYEREMVSYKAFDGIADTLARYLAHLPPVQVAELMPRRAALLSRLFPVLRRVEAIAAAPHVADVPDPQDQRRRMFAAMRELFLRLAQRRRVVWYIDDLQWTDADSLVLLQDLLAGEDPLPVFIVATLRPVDDVQRRTLVDKLQLDAPTERVVLTALTPTEARTLAELLLPNHDAALHATVATDAGGHPLFLHEVARHVGTSQKTAGATLDEILTARIGDLTREARTLLQVVSIYGGPVMQKVAAHAAEMSHGEQVKAARILRAAHLVRTDGVRRTDRIVMYHDRVRVHVLSQLDDERRQHLHERLALALEQTGAAEHTPRALVRHAGAAGKNSVAATHALSAARSAIAALAFDQAAELFATALELGAHDEVALRAHRIDLATALMHAGRGPEAATNFMLAAEGAEPAIRLQCHRQAADQWLITGHLKRGLDVLRAPLAELGEPLASTPRRAVARVVWNRVRLQLRGIRYRTRLESQVPVETLRRLDVLRAVAHGLAMIDNVRGADFNGRFMILALKTGETTRLVGAMGTEIVFLSSQGGRAGRSARRLFRELQKLSTKCPNQPYAQTWLLLADGAASFFEGRFVPAAKSLAQAETIFADGPQGLTYERNNTRVFHAHTIRLLGALKQLGSLLSDWIRTGRQRGDRYLETTLMLLQGQCFLARDDTTQARASITGATWTPPEDGFHLQHWYELRARAELALYEGTAHIALDQLAAKFAELDRSMLLRVKLVRADAAALRGRLLVATRSHCGQSDDAHAKITRIAKKLLRLGAGYADVYGLLLQAGLESHGNQQAREQAVALLRRAIKHATQSGMALHLAAARQRLGSMLGGDEGADLCSAADDYATEQAIVVPHRLYEIVAPGFSRTS